jgi:predicted metal-dependent hydrolase
MRNSTTVISLSHPRLEGETVPVYVRTSPRARRVIVRIMAGERAVELVKPRRASMDSATRFLHEKSSWIFQQLAKVPEACLFVPDALVPVLGQEYRIVHKIEGRGKPVELDLEQREIHVRGQAEHINRRVRDFLKSHARDYIASKLGHYTEKLGVEHSKVSLRDPVSRWGSCSSDGTLSFSWRLVMAPEPVFTYVIAHEVAHLREMNHSLAFWRCVAQLQPDYMAHRRWLKLYGSGLHRYG